MIPIVGDVLFDAAFQFSDGSVGQKWFIILADVGDDTKNVYVARVTSKPKSQCVEGCHSDQYEQVYFLPTGKTFPLDTWVQFDQILIFDFSKAEAIKKSLHKKKQLSCSTMRKILNCAVKSVHIDGYTKRALAKQADLL